MAAVGIDLGTTNSCAAVVKNGTIHTLYHSIGKRILPSIITFDRSDVVIGFSNGCTKNTAQGIKYLIGRNITDPEVHHFMQHSHMKLASQDHKLRVLLERRNKKELFLPEELSAFVLQKLKQTASDFMDCVVDKAVITVPNYFNNSQRRATIAAGKIAGFEEVSLLNESTAAAIAYGIENNNKGPQKILVYDFGGGTFDVTVLQCDSSTYKVLAMDGDLQLGGEDITNNIMDKLVQIMYADFGIDIRQDQRKMAKLKNWCESAKHELSVKESTDLLLDFVHEEAMYTLTRGTFEIDNAVIFEKTLQILQNCLNKAGINKSDIDEVILVGGSAYIPFIRSMLNDFFNKEVKSSICKEEAVAHGAAIVAAKWQGTYFKDVCFENLTPHTLGVEINSGKMDVIIPRYSKIPIAKTKKYKTANLAQNNITVKVFSGEDEYTSNNKFLGILRICGIKLGPDGNTIEETFKIDENGVLTVEAADLSGQSVKLTVNMSDEGLTSDEIITFRQRLHSILNEPKLIQINGAKNIL